uniref:hypothetical protein n=1 Tax=Hylemonella sp. TaxID=2066020 RepID=UPI0035ADD808
MVDDITFNAVCIVESLPPKEVQTGRILHGYIQTQLADTSLPVDLLYSACSGVDEFRGVVASLAEKASERGLLPILHIEAHGSPSEGLCFADDSFLPWQDFCDLITPLNRATGFRLVVVIAACFGADLLSGVRLSSAAPCFAFIAPSDEIDPGEVMNSFRTLYRTMFDTLDAHKTFQALNNVRLEAGGIIIFTAQYWFDLLMSRYLIENATRHGIKEFALRRYRSARAAGEVADMTAMKRHFKAALPSIVRAYFESYFMLKEVSGNDVRFEPLWHEVDGKVKAALRH